MSRQLPPRANFDFLKKQAKELLAKMLRTGADVRLAGAQRQLARDYGFPTWAALKAHVVQRPGLALGGTWQVNLAKSTRPADNLYRSATLQFEVHGDSVTIIDVVVDESGRTERNLNTMVADGRQRQQQHGYAITARWVTPRHLEAALTKDGEPRGHVAYVVAGNGRSLTLATPESVSVFDRVE